MSEKIKKLTFATVKKFKTSPNSNGPIIINTKNGDKEVYKVGVAFQELDTDDLWYATCWDKEDSPEWKVQEGDERKVKLESKYNSWSFPSKSDRQMAAILDTKEKVRQIKFTMDERIIPLLEQMVSDTNGLEDDFDDPKSEVDEIHETAEEVADDDIDPEDIPF